MNNRIFLLGIIIFMVPSVFSFNCETFNGIDRDNCILLNNTDENLIAGLIYKFPDVANHTFIQNYNSNINVNTAPQNVTITNRTYIKNAWISILTINPSVIYHNQTFVPQTVELRTEYSYQTQLPATYNDGRQRAGTTCKINYFLNSNTATLTINANNNRVGNLKRTSISINQDTTLNAILVIDVSVRTEEYAYNNYCNGRRNPDCRCVYKRSTYSSERLTIQDSINVKKYSSGLDANATIIQEYTGTQKGIINRNNATNIILRLDNSSYTAQGFEYYARFTKKPYNFLVIEAVDQKHTSIENIHIDDNTFYVHSSENCTIESSDFFNHTIKSCDINNTSEAPMNITIAPMTQGFTVLFMLMTIGCVIFLIFQTVKKYWGKYIVGILLLFLLMPSVRAEDCGLTNLASCIPEKIYDFLIRVLNAPLQPLLSLMKDLLTNPPSIVLFGSIWAVIVYVLSTMYGFLIMYAGLQLLVSGHSAIRREQAKEWLKNIIIMIVLIQASYYLYGLFLDMGSIMTTGVLSLVDEHFFMLTADNIVNIGLEFLLIWTYVIVLFITILFLTLRYLVVAFGVIFVPIGIFCYFIPPLKSYGRLILNLLGLLIFIGFLDAVIILACSRLIDIELFANFKMLVMIVCLLIIDIVFYIFAKHIINKTGLDDGKDKMMEAVKYVGMI